MIDSREDNPRQEQNPHHGATIGHSVKLLATLALAT